jgi:ribosome maturation factor RimP
MAGRGHGGTGPAAGGRRPAGRGRDAAEPRTAAPRTDLAAAKARVRAVIEPVVAGAGFDLEDVSLSRAGRRHLLRILVDADGGVGLDDVAVVSREISAALDAAEEAGGEVLAGEYQLEVSSPGVDRPLTAPRHWRRNVGRLVTVTVAGRAVAGRLTAADDEGVVLDGRELSYAELGPGRVQIEFRHLDEAEFGDDDEDDGDGEGEQL